METERVEASMIISLFLMARRRTNCVRRDERCHGNEVIFPKVVIKNKILLQNDSKWFSKATVNDSVSADFR